MGSSNAIGRRRTLHPHGAFFTRGSGHIKFGGYTETPDEYQDVLYRLARKHAAAAKYIPAPVIRICENTQTVGGMSGRIGIVSLGGCDAAVTEEIELIPIIV